MRAILNVILATVPSIICINYQAIILSVIKWYYHAIIKSIIQLNQNAAVLRNI